MKNGDKNRRHNQAMADTPLRKCPFCGRANVVVANGAHDEEWHACCAACSATGPNWSNKTTAAKMWNARGARAFQAALRMKIEGGK